MGDILWEIPWDLHDSLETNVAVAPTCICYQKPSLRDSMAIADLTCGGRGPGKWFFPIARPPPPLLSPRLPPTCLPLISLPPCVASGL